MILLCDDLKIVLSDSLKRHCGVHILGNLYGIRRVFAL
jgi:hypothetical protein